MTQADAPTLILLPNLSVSIITAFAPRLKLAAITKSVSLHFLLIPIVLTPTFNYLVLLKYF